MSEPWETADGIRLAINELYFVLYRDEEKIETGILQKVYPNGKKVTLRLATDTGFNLEQDCRVDGVFRTKDAAEEALYNSKVHLTMSKMDAQLIFGSLCEALKKARAERDVMAIAKERELTAAERRMLPYLLPHANRDEIIEQYESWVSYVSNYEDLIQDVEKAIKACTAFV